MMPHRPNFSHRLSHCLPHLLRRLPWLVTVLALWGTVQFPAVPTPAGVCVAGGPQVGPSPSVGERPTPPLGREQAAPRPTPDLPPCPPVPAAQLARQYACTQAQAGAGMRVRAARYGKWQLEGG